VIVTLLVKLSAGFERDFHRFDRRLFVKGRVLVVLRCSFFEDFGVSRQNRMVVRVVLI
jgi:hypothetical protein